MSSLPESVTITDDTMREGLQIERADIPVAEKLRLLDSWPWVSMELRRIDPVGYVSD